MGAEPAIGVRKAGVPLGIGGCGVGTAPIIGGRGGGSGALTLASSLAGGAGDCGGAAGSAGLTGAARLTTGAVAGVFAPAPNKVSTAP